jgi:hypothetical protein
MVRVSIALEFQGRQDHAGRQPQCPVCQMIVKVCQEQNSREVQRQVQNPGGVLLATHGRGLRWNCGPLLGFVTRGWKAAENLVDCGVDDFSPLFGRLILAQGSLAGAALDEAFLPGVDDIDDQRSDLVLIDRGLDWDTIPDPNPTVRAVASIAH